MPVGVEGGTAGGGDADHAPADVARESVSAQVFADLEDAGAPCAVLHGLVLDGLLVVAAPTQVPEQPDDADGDDQVEDLQEHPGHGRVGGHGIRMQLAVVVSICLAGAFAPTDSRNAIVE